ncbi:MAG: hypothetical protein U5K74_11625 [Gemmatimonadaceae bacterium]|nr:hypothetical protein [Gemmatimonadaceae bacterium]
MPMVLDQPLACGAGRVRAEQAVAHELVVQAQTLTTVRFDGAPLPAGTLVAGRVTWRLRPTSAPNYSAGRFNIAASADPLSGIPGAQTFVQIHNIGSVPSSATHTALRPGPWNATVIPSAVLVAADLSASLIAGFNANRAAAQTAGSGAQAFLQTQVGSMVQTTFAILETCHVAVPGPVQSHRDP